MTIKELQVAGLADAEILSALEAATSPYDLRVKFADDVSITISAQTAQEALHKIRSLELTIRQNRAKR